MVCGILYYSRHTVTTLPARYKILPTLAAKLKVMSLKRLPGGLDGVSDALDYSKSGKVSAEKLVLTL